MYNNNDINKKFEKSQYDEDIDFLIFGRCGDLYE